MSVQSRIVPPPFGDDEYALDSDHHNDWSYSARSNARVSLESDADIRHHSGSVSSYGSRASGSTRHGTRDYSAHPRSNHPSNPQRRSVISLSSDDTIADDTELIRLRAENTKLRLDIQRLRGELSSLSYVLKHSI